MQDAREEFLCAQYKASTGIQGFYDSIMDHAQNMAIYPDAYQIMDMFLKGIPATIHDKVFESGMSAEVNTINDIVSQAKGIEMAQKMVDYYRRKSQLVGAPGTMTRTDRRQSNTMDKPQTKTMTTTHCIQAGTKPKKRER